MMAGGQWPFNEVRTEKDMGKIAALCKLLIASSNNWQKK